MPRLKSLSTSIDRTQALSLESEPYTSGEESCQLTRRISSRWEVWKSLVALEAYRGGVRGKSLRRNVRGESHSERNSRNPGIGIGAEVRIAEEKHRIVVERLLRMGVSWWRIVRNDLDSPFMSEGERKDLLSAK